MNFDEIMVLEDVTRNRAFDNNFDFLTLMLALYVDLNVFLQA